MRSSQIRCVVGIDVAKAAHMVCALEAPDGAVRQKPTRIEATAQGYAQLSQWLTTWGMPESVLNWSGGHRYLVGTAL